MPADRSRRTDGPRHGYTGVVAQQGRVILDRDFNAGQGLTAARIATDALDFVGPCGTPDNGFEISLPGLSPPATPFWSPPVTPPLESPPVTVGAGADFLISPGTMYVGGERAEFPAWQDGHAVTYSYFDQPDDPAPPQPNADAQRELVYLELTEQEVSAVEDPDLLEVALGGPDTTQRLKLLRRVRRMPVRAAACGAAWDVAVQHWANLGWQFDPTDMQLVPSARLQVAFTQDAAVANPCDPVATGGYLGADNQLIRVRIGGSKANPTVVWGYDNASFLYPVTTVSPDGTTLTLAYDPPDALHVPQTNQVVEILQTAAVLATEPNETDPGGPQPLLRVVANLNGSLRKLQQPYGPATASSTGNAIVLTTALSSTVAQSELPLFLRVWQAEIPLTVGVATELKDPASGTTTGVTVTITSPGALAAGAFWLIAVRPATPQGAYPESLLKSPQPPDGPRRWACPLAVIDWRAGLVSDCRNTFANLVELSKRKSGCCTVQIDPGQIGGAVSLQSLLDAAAARARYVTVCIAPGEYSLPAPLRFDSRHDYMTMECCGGFFAVFIADPNASPQLFADGLVVVAGARSVTLRGLAMEVPTVGNAQSGTGSRSHAPVAALGNYAGQTGYGVRAFDAPSLTLDRCFIEFAQSTATMSNLFGACVFLQGNCQGLTIQNCRLGSAITPTLTSVVSANQGANTPATPSAPTNVTVNGVASSGSRLKLNKFFTQVKPVGTDLAASIAARSDAALSLVASQDPAAVAAPAATSLITTVGILASPYTSVAAASVFDAALEDSRLLCRLGSASIKANSFIGLTFATWLSAAATTMRLQDNFVTRSVAGFWLEVPGANLEPDNDDGTFPEVCEILEFIVLIGLVPRVPPPLPAASVSVAARLATSTAEVVVNVASMYALFVTGNQTTLGAPPVNDGAATLASAALMCWLYNGNSDGSGQTPLSVTIASNQLLSVGTYAAACATLPINQPVSITGNIVLNQGTNSSTGTNNPSLWLVVAPVAQSAAGITPLLSVTGNVLQGSSNLSSLPRSVGASRQGWSPYNADPT